MQWVKSARVVQFLFRDPVRLLELFSALNLIAWSGLLIWHPEVVERDSYIAFRALGPEFWAVLLLVIGSGQAVSDALSGTISSFTRLVAMSAAAGAWFAIGVSFLSSGVLTTAPANYLALSFFCMFAGAYLGWMQRN